MTGDHEGQGEITIENEDTDAVKVLKESLRDKPKGVTQKFRILIGYLQITSALATSFDIPWPPVFLGLLDGLTIINFNFMDFISPISQCDLHTPFLKQAAFHMAILPLCILVILPATIVAAMCQKVHVVRERAFGLVVTLIFFLYPGIVTRIFVTLKCKTILKISHSPGGVNGLGRGFTWDSRVAANA